MVYFSPFRRVEVHLYRRASKTKVVLGGSQGQGSQCLSVCLGTFGVVVGDCDGEHLEKFPGPWALSIRCPKRFLAPLELCSWYLGTTSNLFSNCTTGDLLAVLPLLHLMLSVPNNQTSPFSSISCRVGPRLRCKSRLELPLSGRQVTSNKRQGLKRRLGQKALCG